MYGDDIKILNNVKYFGSMVQDNSRIYQQILWSICLVQCVVELLSMKLWHCRYMCRRNIQIFKGLVLPVLLYACETWKFCQTGDLSIRLN